MMIAERAMEPTGCRSCGDRSRKKGMPNIQTPCRGARAARGCATTRAIRGRWARLVRAGGSSAEVSAVNGEQRTSQRRRPASLANGKLSNGRLRCEVRGLREDRRQRRRLNPLRGRVGVRRLRSLPSSKPFTAIGRTNPRLIALARAVLTCTAARRQNAPAHVADVELARPRAARQHQQGCEHGEKANERRTHLRAF